MAGKSDLTAAFRNLAILKRNWRYLLMKAHNPLDKKFYFFVNKCMPFGVSISCAHFQAFSDALAHIVEWIYELKMGVKKPLTNYLNDFLFIALFAFMCNRQIAVFMEVCSNINFPVSLEKNEYATTQITFLGLLIDTIKQLIMLPREKIEKGTQLIMNILAKKSNKVIVHESQKLCGFLNFLGRAIVPGRAFTRRLYAYARNPKLKSHHHVRLTGEMKSDLAMWLKFLRQPTVMSRPCIDLNEELEADVLDKYSDASRNPEFGFGATCYESWM